MGARADITTLSHFIASIVCSLDDTQTAVDARASDVPNQLSFDTSLVLCGEDQILQWCSRRVHINVLRNCSPYPSGHCKVSTGQAPKPFGD